MVAAELERVHADRRGVRELQEEDPVSGDLLDARRVIAPGEDVEGVEAGAEGGMISTLHHVPRAPVVGDVTAPRQRLEGDPDAVLLRLLREEVELSRGELAVVDRVRGDVGADEEGVGAQLGHELELVSRSAEVRLERLWRDTLEIAERLVHVDRQAELRREIAHVGRRKLRRDEIGLEDLDAVEARCRRCLELEFQGAAQ